MQTFDIAICGAGPVGQTLALLLIQRGINPAQIVIIDAKTAKQASNDKRTIALSYGSRQILQAASAWPAATCPAFTRPIKATEIHQIHVSRRGYFGRTLIDRSAHHVPALGYVTSYASIIKSLADAIEKISPSIPFLRPVTVAQITQTDTHAHIELADHRNINATIVVQAEGGLFDQQNAQSTHQNYHQTAIAAQVKTSLPVTTRAYERFTEQGPLALLPHQDSYALVWCVPTEHASHLMTLTDDTFLNELQTAFGTRLGRFISSTARFSFPLGLNAQTNLPDGRCIRIGNAAQTLHPVAGQGLNLGLRDAFQLAQCLSQSVEPRVLQDFFYARRTDRKLTVQLTHQLAQIFADQRHLKQTFLSTGLGLLDLFSPAQHWLTKQMMFGYR